MKIKRNFFKLLNKSIFLSKIVRILIAIFRLYILFLVGFAGALPTLHLYI